MEFSPATRAWFDTSFAAPTAAQAKGWEAISRGDHTLILAPTGSGKTLAAFLWAIDRLLVSPPSDECRVLYVSPLKALTYDVAHNLRDPLDGIARQASEMGLEVPDLRVAARTGDTPAAQRRSMARHPPDILVTTPESLYLLLTSRAAGMLAGVEKVIVDEIHALAATKRGAHLALSLERLEELAVRPPQRVGLSATQRPLGELARYLGGQVRPDRGGPSRPEPRQVTIVDAGLRKDLELQVLLPDGNMRRSPGPARRGHGAPVRPDQGARDSYERAGDAGSIWPGLYPRLLELIRAHRTTLVFVNSRRLAERLASRLNELAAGEGALAVGASASMAAGADADLVRAHHGSIARDQRLEIEAALKAGRLRALVATSSLELGIDMGSVDLSVQVGAPSSVSSGLQRIGRAGHSVGEPSRGRIFPKFRHDLLVAAAVAERMKAGLVEETTVPRNPLDVLAQQVVAIVASAEGPVPVERLATIVGRAYPYSDLPPEALHGVLDMLSGRYPSDEYAELRPRLVWDRQAATVEARPGARLLAVTSGGTIPDRGLYAVFTPDGSRVGELDEEMVYESRPGETFVLGATTWRIQEIGRDRVVVVPAPGVPGRMPFWHGDGAGRPFELGEAIGRFTRTLAERGDADLRASCGLEDEALRTLRDYVEEESDATGGALASDRQIVVERFRDELGDWRVAVLSPFGARVHAPWALAVEAALREQSGVECQALWSDDGLILRMPEADEAPRLASVLLDPATVEHTVLEALGSSALFAARFRENAARSLLLTRRRPGSRTPLWQLRRRAADLLRVASRHESFPVLLETYRECLRDVFDLPALVRLLGDIRAGRMAVAEVDLPAPSPFASGLVFAYVAQFMYEGDTPLAERRAQALTLDRRMLSELLGTDELRELLDPGVLARLEEELQGLAPDRRAAGVEDVADLLRRVGDLTGEELAQRASPPGVAGAAWETLTAARRAVPVRVAGETRLVLAEDAARYRDGAGAELSGCLPDVLLEPSPDALLQLVRRWARTHGPFAATRPAGRFGVGSADVESVLRRLGAEGRVVRGGFRPGGEGLEEWCDVDVLRVLRQRSLAALRNEVEPAATEALVRFLPAWHGVVPVGGRPGAGGPSRLLEVIGQLEGIPLPASVLERDILRSRIPDYDPAWLDELLLGGELMWVGAGSLGRGDGRVVLARRQHAGLLLRRLGFDPSDSAATHGETHDHLRDTLRRRGACFFRDLAMPKASDADLLEALWELVWAGEVTSDGLGALRSTSGGRGRTVSGGSGRSGLHGRRLRPRPASVRIVAPPGGQGRWSLVERELGPPVNGGRAEVEAAAAAASVLLDRHGILTREAVRFEGLPGGFAGIYPVLRTLEEAGRIRRGYFVEGLGAAQFAAPGSVDKLRSEARGRNEVPGEVLVLAAADPACALGAVIPWPVRGPGRVAGAHVLFVDGTPAAYLEKGGRGLIALRELDGSWERQVAETLGSMVSAGRWRRLVLQRYPEDIRPLLESAGFVPGPKGLVRYPSATSAGP